jgi:hypothetical protein
MPAPANAALNLDNKSLELLFYIDKIWQLTLVKLLQSPDVE